MLCQIYEQWKFYLKYTHDDDDDESLENENIDIATKYDLSNEITMKLV